jgi:hypothetical protein
VTIFGYPLPKVRKTLLALALFIGTALAYILHYDPSFAHAVQVLTADGLMVVGVFMAPQFSEQDASKAITAAIGAVFSLLKFFGIENPSLEMEIITIIGTGLSVIAIWYVGNDGHRTVLKR